MIKDNSERIAAREARKQDRFARKEDRLAFRDEKKETRAIGKAAGYNGIERLGMRMATKAIGNPEGIVGKAVDFAAKALPQAGQALVKAVSEGGGTLNELNSAGADAVKLTDIEKKDSEILTNTVVKADEELDKSLNKPQDRQSVTDEAYAKAWEEYKKNNPEPTEGSSLTQWGDAGNKAAGDAWDAAAKAFDEVSTGGAANTQIEEKNITDGVIAEGDVNIPQAEKIAETPLPGSRDAYTEWSANYDRRAAAAKVHELGRLKIWDEANPVNPNWDEAQKKQYNIKRANEATTASGEGYSMFEAGKVSPYAAAQPDANVSTLPGGGGTVSNVMNAGGKKTTFDEGMTIYDAKKDIARLALNSPEEISNLALENLNVQDYYPNVNKDIAVGTYSGKYLGTSTIYAAPGAIIPLGLYNERKKALAKAATEKQAAVDKLLATPETSAQYQVQYNEAFFKGLEPFLTNAKDLNSLSSDPEFLKYMANMQGKAREITQSVTFATDMVKAATDDTKYVPKEMQQTSQDVLYNQINNLDAILAGDVNANKAFKDAQVYINMRPQVDALAKDLLNPERMGQSPINLKTGGEFDTETWNKDRSAFFQKVRGGIGYEEYASGIRKYFTGDYESLIDNLIASQPGSSPEQAEALKKYFAAQIQQQDILKYDNIKTDEIAAGRLALDRAKFDYKKEQNDIWGRINEQYTDAVDDKTKLSFNQEIAALNAKNLSSYARGKELERLTKYYGVGNVQYDPVTKSYKSFVAALPSQVGIETSPTDIARQKFLVTRTDVNGKPYSKYVLFGDIKNQTGEFSIGGVQYKSYGNTPKEKWTQAQKRTQSLFDNVKKGQEGGTYTRPIGTEVVKVFEGIDGKTHYLNADNIAQYNASTKKTVVAIPITASFIRVPVKTNAGAGEESEDKYTDVQIGQNLYGEHVNIGNSSGAAIMNINSGYAARAAGDIEYSE